MSTINCGLTIGSTQIKSSQNPNTQISSIEVHSGLAPFVDFAKIIVGTISNPQASVAGQALPAGARALSAGGNGAASAEIDGANVKTGDTITLEVGYDDNLSLVFTGTLTNIEPDISKTILTGMNSANIMTKTLINKTYQIQTAGQIAKDLTNQAGVETDVVEDGVNFPYYVIDDRKHIFQHVIELAEKSGMDLYFTPENKLVMKKFNKTSPDHIFTFGENIIELQIQNNTPLAEQTIVAIESPASSQGNDAWHWFAKDTGPFQGTAGSGKSMLIHDPGIRTKEGADIYAAGKLDLVTRSATWGRIKILGNPVIKLGDAIAIEGVPKQNLNGLFQVRRIKHFLSSEHGFTTTIDFISAASGNGIGVL